jgi:putative heme-binding domain-containing protein
MKYLFLILALFLPRVSRAASEKFELRDGDRVVFIGGVFMEREYENAEIETMLTRHFPDRNFTFRNLGWGGDTVETFVAPAHEPRPKYVPTLLDYVERIKPTVIFISYGMMESFDGEAGLPKFVQNYNALLDKLSQKTQARFVFISPFHHEAIDGDSPEIQTHNRNLQLYANAIEKIAHERNSIFINLFDELHVNGRKPITSNGIHLNQRGYEKVAAIIEKDLELPRAKKISQAAEEELREVIKAKNENWWHHYRPMNSEYVYRNGTRFQDKIGDTQHPLDVEIAKFAKLAENGDKEIAELRHEIFNDDFSSFKSARSRDAATSDIHPPDPELERKAFQVADGFEVNLFAADPLIAKPIQMTFDERGRLFVATTTLYPQIKPGERANDKIIMLQDKDGDGRADKTTIFADRLLIPTGILPGDHGIYVSGDTKIFHFRDTDDDGRADEREIVLSGFGTEDSHHKAHVLRYGPGGNIYFNQGVFLHSTIETPHGIVHQSGNWLAGIFEFQPATRSLDVYLATSIPPNPWGHYWNYWGFDFHIDSSGNTGSNFILPTANKSSTAIPIEGGKGKLAGGEIISGRHFPDEWQGNLIAAPFKENRVARWEFSDDGSGYAMKQLSPLIVSTDGNFRPVDMKMGPDGALYIADWYNPLIGHMQYHFRDPGRDFTHGRIWRVTAKNRPLVPRFDFAKASVNELLDQLKAPENFNRTQAKRILSERNRKDVLSALGKWVKNLNPSETNYEHDELEALWTYQTLNVVEPGLLKKLLRANEPNARAAATMVLRYWHDRIGYSESLDLLSTQIADENPRVRLQAVIALSFISDPRSIEIASRVLQKPMDQFLEQALKNTAKALNAKIQMPNADVAANKSSLKEIARKQAKEMKTSASANGEIKDMSRAELASWIAEVQKNGDAARGEKIFHRADLNCLGCHAIGGAGGQLAPDLSAVGGGSTVDYLLESILFPSKIIKDGFQTVEVTTKDDDTILGVRVRENADELVLKDATRNEIVIPTISIKEKTDRKTSLMPEGFGTLLKHSELIDLAKFLSELGKPGAYANNPKPIVRKWQVLNGVKPQTALARNAKVPWTTAYSFVSGILPLEVMPETNGVVLAQFQIETMTPGKVRLKLNSLDGLSLWVDSASVELEKNPVLNLPKGTHYVTFVVDAKKRATGLRVELEEVPGSPARFQLADKH